MRRGLMTWRGDELSLADIEQRLARLRKAMDAAGLDAFVAYGSFVRPEIIRHLTGFTQFWGDGLLVVGREGRPVYFTVLTNRSNSWIAGLNPACEIVHTPSPGTAAVDHLKADNASAIGVCELGIIPRRIAAVLAQEFDGRLIEAAPVFAQARAEADRTEIALARSADALAMAGLGELDAQAGRVGDIVAAVERAVRLGGCEDCHIMVAPDLREDERLARHPADKTMGAVFAVRASVARHGAWSRRTRTFAADRGLAEKLAHVEARISDWCGTARLDQPFASPPIDGIGLRAWRLEAPAGSYPLQTVTSNGGSGEAAHPYGVMTFRGTVDDTPWIVSQLAIGTGERA